MSRRARPRFVLVEWREADGYHGGSYAESDVPILLAALADKGILSVHLDERETPITTEVTP